MSLTAIVMIRADGRTRNSLLPCGRMSCACGGFGRGRL